MIEYKVPEPLHEAVLLGFWQQGRDTFHLLPPEMAPRRTRMSFLDNSLQSITPDQALLGALGRPYRAIVVHPSITLTRELDRKLAAMPGVLVKT